MELFIRADDIYMEIHKVALKDGHIPMIGDQLPSFLSANEYGYCNPHEIEPAVWFKVMVVDSISIDCTKRAIMWNSDSSLPYIENEQSNHTKQRRRRVSESMYIGGELYGFETDLDELFDTLQSTVIKFASSQISREDFNSEVMRLLHCHVLPLIKLTTEDMPKMRKVFADEEQYIQTIDKLIIEKDKQMDSIMKAMQRQRDTFLSSFITLRENDQSTLTSSAKLCNKELAQVLVTDCESDIVALQQRLMEMQREVEDAKSALARQEGPNADVLGGRKDGSVSFNEDLLLTDISACESELQRKLRECREERNECHTKLKSHLCARENLRVFIGDAEDEEEKQKKKSFMSSFKKIPLHQPLPIHNVYLGMRDKLIDVRSEAKALVDQKVLMISVKEALRSTLRELEVNDESLGVDIGFMHGTRPTDVLRRSRQPKEWLSLAQQVSDLVGHHSNQVCLQHTNKCKIVTDHCQAVVFEKRLMDVSHNASRISCSDICSDTDKSAESGVYMENKIFSIPPRKDSDIDSSNKMTIDGLKIENVSPVNSVLSETSDLGTGTESRISSSSTSQSELSSLLNDNNAQPNGFDSLIQLEGQLGDEDIVIVHNNSRDHLRIAIDELKPQIQEHFESICKLIQNSIENHTQTVNKKVWLCYENHFYEATMEPLMELYKNAFKAVTDRLTHLVPHLTVVDLDLDDTIIANMLQEKVVKPEAEDQGMNVANASSPDLKTDAVTATTEPMSSSEDEFATPPEAPPKSTKPQMRQFRGRLNTHPSQDEVNSPTQKDTKLVQCVNCVSASGLQRVRVYSPMSMTVVRNRQSWPQSFPLQPESPDVSLEAIHLQSTTEEKQSTVFENVRRSLFSQDKPSPVPPSQPMPKIAENPLGVTPICRDVKLKPEFLDKFLVAKNSLQAALEALTPLTKLQSLMRCLREITNFLSEYQFQYNNNETGACSDDIIDMLIILLLNCDVVLIATLYPHIMFLADTLPPFFEGGPYQFCLVQFSVAYQFLQDRLLLKHRSLQSEPPSCIN